MSSSSSSIFNSTPAESTTPTEASSISPPRTPPQAKRPLHTVVSNIGDLKLFLNAIVSNISMPPKLYSQALCMPSPLTPSSKALQHTGVLCEPTSAPPKLFDIPSSTPELYVDAEGVSLSRNGELSILIVHVETVSFSHTYLLHVHILGRRTFDTKSSDGLHSLRSIFQDNRIAKVLFDCRMDSDALFGQYGVFLRGVIDLQLMCLASRGGGRRYLPGLEDCLLDDLEISHEERALVSEAKARGKLLWRPKSGGSMQRFNDNPLLDDIVNYCVVDTAYLPLLFETYNTRIGDRVSLMAVDDLWGNEDSGGFSDGTYSWVTRVLKESRLRAEKALDPDFTGGSAWSPWYHWRMYDDDDD